MLKDTSAVETMDQEAHEGDAEQGEEDGGPSGQVKDCNKSMYVDELGSFILNTFDQVVNIRHLNRDARDKDHFLIVVKLGKAEETPVGLDDSTSSKAKLNGTILHLEQNSGLTLYLKGVKLVPIQ